MKPTSGMLLGQYCAYKDYARYVRVGDVELKCCAQIDERLDVIFNLDPVADLYMDIGVHHQVVTGFPIFE